MICLNMGLEYCHNRRIGLPGNFEIVLDMIDMRIDGCQFPFACATENIRGASRLRMKYLAENHDVFSFSLYKWISSIFPDLVSDYSSRRKFADSQTLNIWR